MKIIEMPEIINLYKKCNVNVEGNGTIRNTFNYGTLNNSLNVGITHTGVEKIDSVLRNNTAINRNLFD